MLKYLFTAHYNDGTTYEQNEEDRSTKEPEKRSCFFDVDHSKLERFTLKGGGQEYTVDLTDGHFEINGVPFLAHEEEGVKDIRLIFWRKHKHSFNQKVDGHSLPEETSHTMSYIIGWQGKHADKNIQRFVEFK